MTIKQLEALILLKEDKCILLGSSKVHGNVMNALYFKDLVRLSRYANGEFWELNDKGYDIVKNYHLFKNLSPDEIYSIVCNKT